MEAGPVDEVPEKRELFLLMRNAVNDYLRLTEMEQSVLTVREN